MQCRITFNQSKAGFCGMFGLDSNGQQELERKTEKVMKESGKRTDSYSKT